MDNPQARNPDWDSHTQISIDLSGLDDVLETSNMASGLTFNGAAAQPALTISAGSGTPYLWTTTGTASGPTLSVGDDWIIGSNKLSSTLSLQGEGADIDINGVSLIKTLEGIKQQLNILTPDADMEQEWDELRSLREQYDAKLQECREKSRMWKTLKAMPPPPKP